MISLLYFLSIKRMTHAVPLYFQCFNNRESKDYLLSRMFGAMNVLTQPVVRSANQMSTSLCACRQTETAHTRSRRHKSSAAQVGSFHKLGEGKEVHDVVDIISVLIEKLVWVG